MARSLTEHASRIQTAIEDAFADGFFLDDGSESEIHYMELNDSEYTNYVGIEVPQ